MNRGVRLAFLILLVGLFAYGAWNLREFGEPGEAGDGEITLYNAERNSTATIDRTEMDGFVLGRSQSGESSDEEAVEDGPSTNNAVTAVVFDYRGIDTIGEATVLFAAVSSVLVTIRVALPPKDKKKGGES